MTFQAETKSSFNKILTAFYYSIKKNSLENVVKLKMQVLPTDRMVVFQETCLGKRWPHKKCYDKKFCSVNVSVPTHVVSEKRYMNLKLK